MPERLHVHCGTCGGTRPAAAFGGTPEWVLKVQHLGDGRGVWWETQPLPVDLARKLRDQARAALDRLEAEIRAAEAELAEHE